MGLYSASRLSSSSYSSTNQAPTVILSGNPNPKRFELLDEYVGEFGIAIRLRYPDCTNYEGIKILVYMGLDSFSQVLIKNKMEVDPHFHKDDEFYSPSARFAPNGYGWKLAKLMTDTKFE